MSDRNKPDTFDTTIRELQLEIRCLGLRLAERDRLLGLAAEALDPWAEAGDVPQAISDDQEVKVTWPVIQRAKIGDYRRAAHARELLRKELGK